jgi:hypothetical protein
MREVTPKPTKTAEVWLRDGPCVEAEDGYDRWLDRRRYPHRSNRGSEDPTGPAEQMKTHSESPAEGRHRAAQLNGALSGVDFQYRQPIVGSKSLHDGNVSLLGAESLLKFFATQVRPCLGWLTRQVAREPIQLGDWTTQMHGHCNVFEWWGRSQPSGCGWPGS